MLAMNDAEEIETVVIFLGSNRGLNKAEYDEWCRFAEYSPVEFEVCYYPYVECVGKDEFLGDETGAARAWLEATWKRWLP